MRVIGYVEALRVDDVRAAIRAEWEHEAAVGYGVLLSGHLLWWRDWHTGFALDGSDLILRPGESDEGVVEVIQPCT